MEILVSLVHAISTLIKMRLKIDQYKVFLLISELKFVINENFLTFLML